MRWLSIKGWEHRRQKKSCWHYWFAWYPVCVHKYYDGAKKVAWLEVVERKGKYEGGEYGGWDWSYRLKEGFGL